MGPRPRHEGADLRSATRTRRGRRGFLLSIILPGEADVITFHTPLTHDGPDATFHILGSRFLSQCERRPLLINAGAGSCGRHRRYYRGSERGNHQAPGDRLLGGEPAISRELLELASVATPHIAGYSLEGKMRATQMALDAFTSHFNLPAAGECRGMDLERGSIARCRLDSPVVFSGGRYGSPAR